MKIVLPPRNRTDAGGFLTMPLKVNVPEPNDKSWTLTTCPVCGRECWKRPVPEWLLQSVDGVICTECALKVNQTNGVNKK